MDREARPVKHFIPLAFLAAVSFTMAACGSAQLAPSPNTIIATQPNASSVQQLLASVPIKGRAAKTGYSRAAFGPAWQDVDHNGCDTRNDILARDLHSVVKTGRCKVLSGLLDDPYTGTTIRWKYGLTTSTVVQIDHVVALGDAWVTGAQTWTADTRLHYANDPDVLRAVSGPANEAKGDSDAASWLPPDRKDWCDYVSQQTRIKAKYTRLDPQHPLWMTQAEHDRIASVLNGCP